MDIQLKRKPWYVRYRYYIGLGVLLLILLGYAVVLAWGPRRLHVDKDSVRVAEVMEDNFLEYVDVEGIVSPIQIVKVNAIESGFVERIVADDGAMLEQGDTILILRNPELMRTIIDEEDELHRQQRLYREQEIEMEQKLSLIHI